MTLRTKVAGIALGAALLGAGAASAPLFGESSNRFSITVTPGARSVKPTGTVTYAIRVRRRGRSKVTLRITTPRPRGVTVQLRRRAIRGSRVRLRVTARHARPGRYRLRLLARQGSRRRVAWLTLVVRSAAAGSLPPRGFKITGDLSRQLEPGLTVPLNLALTNHGTRQIAISGLEVRIGAIAAPGASAARPCTTEDFSVVQFSGGYGFTLPPWSTRTLSDLGVPPAQWPQVAMRDRPVNQDGCKAASLNLDYAGTWSAP